MEILVNGKCYNTLRELYDDQNETKKAEIRQFLTNMGYSEGSIHRKLNEEIPDRMLQKPLYHTFGILYHPQHGIFFEQKVEKNSTLNNYGLS